MKKYTEEQIVRGTKEEMDHAKTFEMIRKNPSMSNQEAARAIAIEHLELNPNSYNKPSLEHGGPPENINEYANQYFGKGFEDDAAAELRKALPNHNFIVEKNKIIVDGGKFVITTNESRYGFIREYKNNESIGGIGIEKLSEAIGFIVSPTLENGGNLNETKNEMENNNNGFTPSPYGGLVKEVKHEDGTFRRSRVVEFKGSVRAHRVYKFKTTLGFNSAGYEVPYESIAEALAAENRWLNEETMADGGNTNAITKKDIVVGAKFKIKSGTVFIIDEVKEDPNFGIAVRTSFEGGSKGNFRDSIEEIMSFLNEENAQKQMDSGGEFNVGDYVWLQTDYGKHYGTIKGDYTDRKFYAGNQYGYEITGIGDRISADRLHKASKEEYEKLRMANGGEIRKEDFTLSEAKHWIRIAEEGDVEKAITELKGYLKIYTDEKAQGVIQKFGKPIDFYIDQYFNAVVYVRQNVGKIPNNYAGKTPEQVWNAWSEKQRKHFLYDHDKDLTQNAIIDENTMQDTYTSDYIIPLTYNKLPPYVKDTIKEHISDEQYDNGGSLKSAGFFSGGTPEKDVMEILDAASKKSGKKYTAKLIDSAVGKIWQITEENKVASTEIGGRGFFNLTKGKKITDANELKEGDIILGKSKQFNAQNTYKIVGIRKYGDTIQNDAIYWNPQTNKRIGNEDMSISQIEIDKNEYYFPEAKIRKEGGEFSKNPKDMADDEIDIELDNENIPSVRREQLNKEQEVRVAYKKENNKKSKGGILTRGPKIKEVDGYHRRKYGLRFNKICPVGTKIQHLQFQTSRFSMEEAKEWTTKHKFKWIPRFVTEKANAIHARQQPAAKFKLDSFKTIELTDGVQAVIACQKK